MESIAIHNGWETDLRRVRTKRLDGYGRFDVENKNKKEFSTVYSLGNVEKWKSL